MSGNINDPAAISALLDRLRNSREWANISTGLGGPSASTSGSSSSPSDLTPGPVAERSDSTPPIPTAEVTGSASATRTSSDGAPTDDSLAESAPVSSHISSLLSRLSSDKLASGSTPLTQPHAYDGYPKPTSENMGKPTMMMDMDTRPPPQMATFVLPEPRSRPSRPYNVAPEPLPQHLRNLSFNQALPYLTRLASDPDFMKAVQKLREDQLGLEKRLWAERGRLVRVQENKIKDAKLKADIVGGLGPREIERLSASVTAELQKFDTTRVLAAWDDLVSKQQTQLEELGVPTVFLTSLKSDRDRQQKVLQLLESMVADD